MTETIIALLSILVGIIGANLVVYFLKHTRLDVRASTILGVFGSVFIVKSFGRLGFGPSDIMATGSADMSLLLLNLFLSLLGGGLLVVAVLIFRKRYL